MIRVFVLLSLLVLGGCAGHHRDGVSGEEDADYKARSRCQTTAEGNDTKSVCY